MIGALECLASAAHALGFDGIRGVARIDPGADVRRQLAQAGGVDELHRRAVYFSGG
jgi:hypothetical protein